MWEPSNEIEHRLREALRAEDQEGYFSILSQIELLLPVSQDDPSGVNASWATWTSDDRTHVLAFTSETAMNACLSGGAGPAKPHRLPALAAAWPNEQWWLAVNPGLPIEGYLPAWFVSELSSSSPPPQPAPGPPAQQPNPGFGGSGIASDAFGNRSGPPPADDRLMMPPAPHSPDLPPTAVSPSDQQRPPAPPPEGGLPRRQPATEMDPTNLPGPPPNQAPAPSPAPAATPAAPGGNADQLSELTGAAAEEALTSAATSGDTSAFLMALMRTTVLLPVPDTEVAAMRVGDPNFRWDSDIVDGIHGITVFTTKERLIERMGERPYVTVPFGWLAQHWPGHQYALYVNPGTTAGANMPGAEIGSLIKWAKAKDLLEFSNRLERSHSEAAAAQRQREQQKRQPRSWVKLLPHHQVPYYLERGYDRVAGHITLAEDVAGYTSPAGLYSGLQLDYNTNSDFHPSDNEAHVIRWVGYRTALYSPSHEKANGIRVYSVHSIHLPHGATMLRLNSTGEATEVATFDADRRAWIPVGPSGPAALESAPASGAGHTLDQRQAQQWGGV
ncbi:SseB family protein [Haloglycomyces albus]|uniref:SseB family protein n=1 Tax=Haloglycomyces albus TaxID=526067 RepID=UPI00046D2F82|nr:SseB family protein [Haloglycomyces albus]